MDIAAQLSDLRRDVSGCHIAAFVDLSAKMVMAHDARSKAPQERLDALADRAERLLNTPDVAPPTVMHALAISEHGLEIYLRDASRTDDSLALVCSPDAHVEMAIERGVSLLQGLNADA